MIQIYYRGRQHDTIIRNTKTAIKYINISTQEMGKKPKDNYVTNGL